MFELYDAGELLGRDPDLPRETTFEGPFCNIKIPAKVLNGDLPIGLEDHIDRHLDAVVRIVGGVLDQFFDIGGHEAGLDLGFCYSFQVGQGGGGVDPFHLTEVVAIVVQDLGVDAEQEAGRKGEELQHHELIGALHSKDDRLDGLPVEEKGRKLLVTGEEVNRVIRLRIHDPGEPIRIDGDLVESVLNILHEQDIPDEWGNGGFGLRDFHEWLSF